jgi:hypothetical protein
MSCPANMLGYLPAFLRPKGRSCGVRELAPAVCRSGLPGHAPRSWHSEEVSSYAVIHAHASSE